MRKLLITTTALSVAFSPLNLLPARAQTLLDDGSVVAEDGSILCTPTADAACDLKEIRKEQRQAERKAERQAEKAAEAEAAAQAEADAAAAAAAAATAQAEADAAAAAAAATAQAEADAAAAATAQAEADAAAQAQAEADAKAAADAAAADAAQLQADAAAKAQADADAAAAAQLQAEADAKAAAEAAAKAQAEAETQVDGDTRAAARAAAKAEAEAAIAAQAQLDAAADAEAKAKAAEEAAAAAILGEGEAGADVTVTADPVAPETPAVDPAVEATADVAVETPAEPVEAPVAAPEAVETLSELLAAPTATETGLEGTPLAPAIAAAAAAAAGAGTAPAAGTDATATTETTTEAPAPVNVIEQVITEADTRSSAEEFTAAPTAVEGGKKSGLSDLEKVGLVALGGLIVGAILNDGKKVVSNTGDRVVLENPNGGYTVYKDDDVLLRRPGVKTTTESYRDGSTRTIVTRDDGSQVVTIRDAAGRVLKRSAYDRNGIEYALIDDLYPEVPIVVSELPKPRPSRVVISSSGDDAALKAEMAALEARDLGRSFSLRQIREIAQVRALAATIEVDNITFDTGSSVIRATEAKKLADIGRIMGDILDRNPREVFLIEGHTDAVGSAASNLSLSDRRAESLALALTEYFEVPPENLVVQGYGESELKIESAGDERANRRVAIRLVSPLMRNASN